MLLPADFARMIRDLTARVRRLETATPYINRLRFDSSTGPTIQSGTGAPGNVVSAPVGSLYLRTDGGSGLTLYVKESGGSGATGWSAK